MLAGAMDELTVGYTGNIDTDVGPVIDQDALDILEKHAEKMDKSARKLAQAELGPDCEHGSFFAPRVYEIGSISDLEREVFGPVLHVVRYKARDLDKVIDAINGTGYGLTLGIHTRVDDTAEYIASRVKVGNCYVNRNQIGAVVGVQPFGGEGLSGTGPKAGGPHYLPRLACERVSPSTPPPPAATPPSSPSALEPSRVLLSAAKRTIRSSRFRCTSPHAGCR